MVWTIEYTTSAKAHLRKLDKALARRIADFLDNRIAVMDNPRSKGRALAGSLSGLWRYRVGDYRIICDIQDSAVRVIVVRIGNRKEVYR